MRAEDIKEIIHRQPFRPVVLYLSDGEQVLIDHPEMAVISRFHAMVPTDVSEDGILERSRWINLLHIVRIEDAPSNGNGHPRRKRKK